MAFKRANSLNPTSQATVGTQTEEKEAVKRYKPKPGVNILMVLPSLSDKSPLPYRHIHVHYNPFHLCLRPDPHEDAEGNVTIDKRFGPCPRCQSSWDAIEAEGLKGMDLNAMPPGPQRERLAFLKSQRAAHQIVWQVLDLTAFFNIREVRKAYQVTPNTDLIEYLDLFGEVVAGKKPIDVLPEELHSAAEFGLSRICVAKTNGLKMRDAYFNRYMSLGEVDPLTETAKPHFMKIILTDSGKTMSNGGKESKVYDWTPQFTTDAEVAGISLSDDFISNLEDVGIDIYGDEPKEETRDGYNEAFRKPASKDVLASWLADAKWSLGDGEEVAPPEEPSEDEIRPFGAPAKRSATPGTALGRYSERQKAQAHQVDDSDIPF